VHIALVLPFGHRFAADTASSISTCAHDFARASAGRARITVIGSACDQPFDDVAFVPLPDPPNSFVTSQRADYARSAAKALRALSPDAVLVELDGWLGAALARASDRAPVALRLHSDANKVINGLKGLRRRMRLRLMAGLVCVSPSMATAIRGALGPATPVVAAPNGVNLDLWRGVPDWQKSKVIVFAGRLLPQKGVVELCEATAMFLQSNAGRDWQAVFLVSDVEKNLDLDAHCRRLLGPVSGRIHWLTNMKRGDVRSAMQAASIVVVPSKVIEGFGMVAAEAHAAGCAVISSGLGGLRDASGDAARYLSEVTPAAIAEALEDVSAQPALSAWRKNSRDHAAASLGLDATAHTIHTFLTDLVLRRNGHRVS
jgi:glycosyltransferase involved in cell wall biosynthesis